MGTKKVMDELTEDIFQLDSPVLLSHNRKKEDYLAVEAITGTNKFNDNITIRYKAVDPENYLYLPGSFLRCEYEIKKANGTEIDTEITLENNWFPHLFENIIFRIGSSEVENVIHPGECDTMMKLVTKNNLYNNDGWILDRGDGKIVEKVGNPGAAYAQAEVKAISDHVNKLNSQNTGYLSRKEIYNVKGKKMIEFHLNQVLGYFAYEKISHNLTFELELRRNVDHEKIFFGDDGTNAKIVIANIQWLIPKITPSLEIENMITKRLLQNKPIPVIFLKRNIHQTVVESTLYNWPIQTSSSIPRYLFLTFKSETKDFKTNYSLTLQKEAKLKKLQIMLNQTPYPIYPMEFKLDDDHKIYSDAFIAYKEMCKTFGVSNQLNAREFNDLYPIYCFDLTAFPEKTIPSGVNVTLKIEKGDNTKLLAYCLVLTEEHKIIENTQGRMNRIV